MGPNGFSSGSTTLDGATYTVDNAGNRVSKTQQPTGPTSNFTYDAIYELTQVMQGANTTESYTYDPVGNRLSSLGVSPYAVNASNELTSTPSTSYAYDHNGNTLTKTDSTGTTNYTWDFENRLTSLALPGSGGTVTFKYDPFGRRIYKSSSSATSIFAYDGDNLVEETNSSGAVVARYSDGLNIDEPVAMLRSSATSYYHADGLGSITSLSNGAGSLAQTYTFDSFGKQTASSGSLTNPFQYTGRESDTETGLYYYRARYYDQSVGRFISEDPLKSVLPSMNFYPYVRNRPTFFVDRTGKDPQTFWDTIGSAWNRLKRIRKIDTWMFCGVYYARCADVALDCKLGLCKATGGNDILGGGTDALVGLAQQLGVSGEDAVNLFGCMMKDPNCQKALECAKNGITNPFRKPL